MLTMKVMVRRMYMNLKKSPSQRDVAVDVVVSLEERVTRDV
jgi:hypothetical protein